MRRFLNLNFLEPGPGSRAAWTCYLKWLFSGGLVLSERRLVDRDLAQGMPEEKRVYLADYVAELLGRRRQPESYVLGVIVIWPNSTSRGVERKLKRNERHSIAIVRLYEHDSYCTPSFALILGNEASLMSGLLNS